MDVRNFETIAVFIPNLRGNPVISDTNREQQGSHSNTSSSDILIPEVTSYFPQTSCLSNSRRTHNDKIGAQIIVYRKIVYWQATGMVANS